MVALLVALGASNGFAQQEPITLKTSFEGQGDSYYPERVFLQTDKSVYATGEILWMKAIVTDALTHHFSELSKICYIELIGTDHKVVLQGKLDIDSAEGNGSFQIPASVGSGNYCLRAYTNWMKNFGPRWFFRKVITIINPNKAPEFSAADTALKPQIRFFPEGGNLVAGLRSTVAFRITDAYGSPLSATGIVFNDKNDTLATFRTEKFGMGSFSFIPSPGSEYFAQVTLKDTVLSIPLPRPSGSGWVMHTLREGNLIETTVNCNRSPEHKAYLLVISAGKIIMTLEQPLAEGKCRFTFDTSLLLPGICEMTLYNEARQPVAETGIFRRPVNAFPLRLSTDEPAYSFREKVHIHLDTGDTALSPGSYHLSASVYLIDSLQPAPESNIVSDWWLSSVLKGPIESPTWYFEDHGAQGQQVANLLMLTQDWSPYNWKTVGENQPFSPRFLPEVEGPVITGRLFPKSPNYPDSGIHVYLSVPGKDFRFSSTISSDSGLVRFNISKFYGSHEIIAQTSPLDSNYRVFIESPFSDQFNPSHPRPLVIHPNLENEIMTRSLGAQAINAYQPQAENHFLVPESIDTTPFFGIGDKTYNLDDYTRFPTLEEDMREYVKEVHVRKKEGNFHFEVLNDQDLSYFRFDPLVLIDGVPVFSVNKILSVDPLKIQKVAIETNMFFQGSQQYDGIVSYQTYNGDLNGYELNPNSLEMEYDGLQMERSFYQPDYESSARISSPLPDYRNVLLWKPDLTFRGAKKDFSLYASDIPGKYLVVVQGISAGGNPVYATTTFTVVAEPKQ